MNEIKHASIIEITLLSIEEYEASEDNIPPLAHWWWLRSPGILSRSAACVRPGGGVCGNGYYVNYANIGVRPALRVNPESINLSIIPIRGKTRFGGEIWTRIAEDVFLCDRNICQMPFRKDHQADANCYDTSDIKPYLDEWLENAKAFQGNS